MSKKPKLTRRRALAGLGTIGAGAVVGGAGTMAWLNDQESLNGTSMTAGTLDLKVKASATADRGLAGNVDITGNSTFESDVNLGLSLGDCKPGDSGQIIVCLKVTSNPAWVWINADLTLNADAYNTEPELAVDSDIGAHAGDLAAAIDATLKYENGSTITHGSLAEILAHLHGGLSLDYDSDHEYFPADSKRCLVIDWKIPTDVGNEIQGDELKFDLMFAAQQRRHNADPTSPWA